MRAAIYARYSSENQQEASIDDQVRSCGKLIEESRLDVRSNLFGPGNLWLNDLAAWLSATFV